MIPVPLAADGVPVALLPWDEFHGVLEAPIRNDWQAGAVTTGDQRVIGMVGGMSWESSAEYYR